MSINWGDVPTWLAATGTTAAFGVTFWQLRHVREQTALLRAEHDDEAKSQARLIVVLGPFRGSAGGANFRVRNESDRPVRAVRVVSPYFTHHQVTAWRLAGMWVSQEGTANAYDLDPQHDRAADNGELVLPPGRALWVGVDFLNDGGQVIAWQADDTARPTLDIEFVDDRGRRWQRWANVEPRPATVSAVHREPPPALPERQ